MTAVAAATLHSLAVKSDGTVWAWGYNMFGQLGNGTTTDSHVAIQVHGLRGITAVAGGVYTSLALESDGTVWAWGYNHYGELGVGNNVESHVPVQVIGVSNVKAIACGNGFGLALRSDRTVWAWGFNRYGQLGNGSNADSNAPIQAIVLGGINSIVASSTSFHGLALAMDGSVWSWGLNRFGQLGDGSTSDRDIPRPIPGLTSVIALSAGSDDSLAVR